MFERIFVAAPSGTPNRARGLHVCSSCTSPLVQLESHADAGDGHWHLRLRCPECHVRVRRTVPDALCAEFDEELEEGTLSLLDGLSRIQKERMSDDIDVFTAALDTGLLLPEDF